MLIWLILGVGTLSDAYMQALYGQRLYGANENHMLMNRFCRSHFRMDVYEFCHKFMKI